jgi:uncharacterized membrane protein
MAEPTSALAFVAAFPDEEGASRALRELRRSGDGPLGVRQAAVLVRDAVGRLEIRELHRTGRGGVLGGVASGVIGLIAGADGWPPGGPASGPPTGTFGYRGFPDERLRETAEALQPGTSALVAILERRHGVEVGQSS